MTRTPHTRWFGLLRELPDRFLNSGDTRPFLPLHPNLGAAVTCSAPALSAGEVVVLGCAGASRLGSPCVRSCRAQYTARGPTTYTCSLVAPHVAQWVAEGDGNTLSCTAIASLFCETDGDCRRIDKEALCVPVSTTAAASAIATARSDVAGLVAIGGTPSPAASPESSPPTFPQPATMGGCRCSSARYTGYFCEEVVGDDSPVQAVVPTWSIAPALGAIIAVVAVVAVVTRRRRDGGSEPDRPRGKVRRGDTMRQRTHAKPERRDDETEKGGRSWGTV